MRALLVFLTSLCCATVAAAQPGPTAYVWQLTCAGDESLTFGPYSTPDQCREYRAHVAGICERPLDGPNRPNPDFVRIADVCQRAHNGRDCVCDYWAVPARRPFVSLGDLFRAQDTACAAGRPCRTVLDVWNAYNAPRAAAAPTGPIKVGP